MFASVCSTTNAIVAAASCESRQSQTVGRFLPCAIQTRNRCVVDTLGENSAAARSLRPPRHSATTVVLLASGESEERREGGSWERGAEMNRGYRSSSRRTRMKCGLIGQVVVRFRHRECRPPTRLRRQSHGATALLRWHVPFDARSVMERARTVYA